LASLEFTKLENVMNWDRSKVAASRSKKSKGKLGTTHKSMDVLAGWETKLQESGGIAKTEVEKTGRRVFGKV